MYVYILTIKVKRICIYFDNKGKAYIYMYVYILTIKIQLRTHEDKGNKHTLVSQDKRTVEKKKLREKGFQGKFERTVTGSMTDSHRNLVPCSWSKKKR